MKNNQKIRNELESALSKLQDEKIKLEKEFLCFADENMNKTRLKQTCKYLAKEKLSLVNKNIKI